MPIAHFKRALLFKLAQASEAIDLDFSADQKSPLQIFDAQALAIAEVIAAMEKPNHVKALKINNTVITANTVMDVIKELFVDSQSINISEIAVPEYSDPRKGVAVNVAKSSANEISRLTHETKTPKTDLLIAINNLNSAACCRHSPMGFPKGRIGILPFGRKRELASRLAKSIGKNSVACGRVFYKHIIEIAYNIIHHPSLFIFPENQTRT